MQENSRPEKTIKKTSDFIPKLKHSKYIKKLIQKTEFKLIKTGNV